MHFILSLFLLQLSSIEIYGDFCENIKYYEFKKRNYFTLTYRLSQTNKVRDGSYYFDGKNLVFTFANIDTTSDLKIENTDKAISGKTKRIEIIVLDKYDESPIKDATIILLTDNINISHLKTNYRAFSEYNDKELIGDIYVSISHPSYYNAKVKLKNGNNYFLQVRMAKKEGEIKDGHQILRYKAEYWERNFLILTGETKTERLHFFYSYHHFDGIMIDNKPKNLYYDLLPRSRYWPIDRNTNRKLE